MDAAFALPRGLADFELCRPRRDRFRTYLLAGSAGGRTAMSRAAYGRDGLRRLLCGADHHAICGGATYDDNGY